MKFGLNGLRSWDRSIWIIPERESIDASKKIFLFNLVVPWWNDERIFFIENTRELQRIVVVLEEKGGKKKRRVNWRMQFWRNSLGVNCSILHNSNNSTNELHYYVDMGFHGIVHYGEGASFCDIYDSVTRIPPDQLSPTWSIVSIEGDTRFEKLSKRLLREFASNLFSRDENKDRCNRTI